MKQLKKNTKLAMMALFFIMGIGFLFRTPNVNAAGYKEPPKAIVFGQTYTGQISYLSDRYRYDMTVKKAGKVRLTGSFSDDVTWSDYNYLHIHLYNEAEESIRYEMIENPYYDFTVNLGKGKYYIVVDQCIGAVGTTTFTLKATHQNFPTSSVKRLKNLSGKKLKVTWAKKAAVSGYQIQVATNSKFTKNKKTYTVRNASATSKTISKLKKSKKYYVRIRTYTVTQDEKTAYSGWSKSKTIKILK